MKRFENQQFVDHVVSLDGKEFVNCTFTRCVLRYRGGQLILRPGCSAVDCRPVFTDAAMRTIELLGILGLLKPKEENNALDTSASSDIRPASNA